MDMSQNERLVRIDAPMPVLFLFSPATQIYNMLSVQSDTKA